MAEELVKTRIEGELAYLALNRPEKRGKRCDAGGAAARAHGGEPSGGPRGYLVWRRRGLLGRNRFQ